MISYDLTSAMFLSTACVGGFQVILSVASISRTDLIINSISTPEIYKPSSSCLHLLAPQCQKVW